MVLLHVQFSLSFDQIQSWEMEFCLRLSYTLPGSVAIAL